LYVVVRRNDHWRFHEMEKGPGKLRTAKIGGETGFIWNKDHHIAKKNWCLRWCIFISRDSQPRCFQSNYQVESGNNLGGNGKATKERQQRNVTMNSGKKTQCHEEREHLGTCCDSCDWAHNDQIRVNNERICSFKSVYTNSAGTWNCFALFYW